jgi:DNA-binding MarR family transcriptional regulator
MDEERIISSEAAARALAQDHHFLPHFLTPQSPSDVATRLGMAANLAHHHAKKLEALGLLREVRRENRKVYYQLTAKAFRVPMDVLPPGDPDENGVHTMNELSRAFLKANARSWSYASAGQDGALYSFEDMPDRAGKPTQSGGTEETHPAHLDRLTLRLTPERYRRLALALSELLTEAASEGKSSSGECCTLAVLGFRDTRNDGVVGFSRGTSTFLPWLDPSPRPASEQ